MAATAIRVPPVLHADGDFDTLGRHVDLQIDAP